VSMMVQLQCSSLPLLVGSKIAKIEIVHFI
jgi:hypothetical protein